MQNIYETIRSSLQFNKFEAGELLFVEYSCPLEDESTPVWSQTDYLVHGLSGRKTWRTTQGRWIVDKGQTLFIKKGATIVDQFFDDEFCMLGFFISDDFIRNIVKEISGQIETRVAEKEFQAAAIEVNNNVILSTYFQSMLTYFSGSNKPADSLLVLKLKELIINILTSPDNPTLSAYLQSLVDPEKPAIQQIMEANFCHNLSLEEFAKLCNRSLSTFKRDFKKLFRVSPGKWLLTKRLEYAAVLLRNSTANISQIAFECGFEDLSHFSKAFKEKFDVPPLQFRQE